MIKTSFSLACILLASMGIMRAQSNTFPFTGSVGIGTVTPDGSALLELQSTTQGFLAPRMTKTQRDAILAPATGLLIYQTNSTPGFYVYSGTGWQALTSKGATKSLNNLSAETAVNSSLLPQFTAAIDLGSMEKHWRNIYLSDKIYINGNPFIWSSFSDNAAFGANVMANTTTGSYNTGVGNATLLNNDSGNNNTGIGYSSLFSNTTGSGNSCIGAYALYANTWGTDNTAVGYLSLNSIDGYANTAVGAWSLTTYTSGSFNTALGFKTMEHYTTGYDNTAIGSTALNLLATGNRNTSVGSGSMYWMEEGSENSALGYAAGWYPTPGSYNTYVGAWSSGYNEPGIYNSTAIGYATTVSDDDQVRIGNTSVTSIGGNVGWTNLSDGRYKKDVQENVPGLEFINQLKPVTYHLDVQGLHTFLNEDRATDEQGIANTHLTKSMIAKEQITYTGFIAQEVEAAAKKLGFDFSGVDAPKNDQSLYGLRYAEFVVPLVKAVQELSAQNDEQQKQIASLESEHAQLQERLSAIEQYLGMTSQSSSTQAHHEIFIEGSAYTITLDQNIPNPFNGTTKIRYTVPAELNNALLQISTMQGNILHTETLQSGHGSVTVHTGDLPAGQYIYHLIINDKIMLSKNMTIAR